VSISLLAKNQLGREITWNYYRENYINILTEFGYENTDIGRTFVDIVKTFSDEFYYNEVKIHEKLD
jgi:hypothetical protein